MTETRVEYAHKLQDVLHVNTPLKYKQIIAASIPNYTNLGYSLVIKADTQTYPETTSLCH